MDIVVRMRGATAEECQRGAEAARAVFDRIGVSPKEAAHGMSMLEAWDINGFQEGGGLAQNESRAADAWLEAEIAATDACCRDWPAERARASVSLELLYDQEIQLADRDTALQKLREIVAAEKREPNADIAVAALAERATDSLPYEADTRGLVGAVTIAFTRLQIAREQVYPKRKAVLAAIDALEQATDMRH